MTTALITTCDRCERQLASKPASRPTAIGITQFSQFGGGVSISSQVSPPPPKLYDLCHVCAAAFENWLSAGRPGA